MRADVFLVESGLAATRSQAQRLIAAGVQWRVPGGVWQAVRKSGEELPPGAELQLQDAAEARYVSRGGLKLEGALAACGLDVAGMRCLDVGQSTGGFTDCLLAHGAAHVTGVDVGHGQLHPRLAQDARVTAIECVNARHLHAGVFVAACAAGKGAAAPAAACGGTGAGTAVHASVNAKGSAGTNAGKNVAMEANAPHAPALAANACNGAYGPRLPPLAHDAPPVHQPRTLQSPAPQSHPPLPKPCQPPPGMPPFDLIVGDLSFISLTLVLPALVPLLAAGGHVLMLVKPQFELQPSQIGKGGIVRDAALYVQVEQRLRAACADCNLRVRQWLQSPIAGGDGNREFFIHARNAQRQA